MTSNIEDIEAALKTTVGQIGLNVYATIPDVANSPAVVVDPWEIDFQSAMAMGGDTYYFTLYVLVANKVTAEAQRKLNEFITGRGPKSLREFVFRNRNLGLPDVTASVEKLVRGSYGAEYTVGTTKFVGAALRVCVVVT